MPLYHSEGVRATFIKVFPRTLSKQHNQNNVDDPQYGLNLNNILIREIMKYIKFILLGVSTILLMLSIALLVPLASSKVADEVGTRFSKDNLGVGVSISIRPLTKYKIKNCDIKVTYLDAHNNVVTNKTIKLEGETSKQWYDELNKFTTEPVEIHAEIIDYQVDFGADIALEVLCVLGFAGTLISALVLFKKRKGL